MSYIELSGTDLALAALLLIVNGAISIAFRLGLAISFGVAAVRMAVQLAAVGFVLNFIFAQTSPLWTLLIVFVMVLVAGYELVQRQECRFRSWLAYGLGNLTLLLVGGLATVYAVVVVVHPSPWYAPRYIVPILGMVLGNTLTSCSLALQTLTEGAVRDRAAIEARIALGATRIEAFGTVLRRALNTAITPLLNVMSVAGIVSLPGMMTGQILAGANPAEAAKYQIMIMFVLTGASGLGAFAAAFGGVLLLTDTRHRLRLDRLASGPA
ncbi:MAG: iron export ABC transporter permease subunit FetB [Hyphomicrobiaceae bacterium]|nr:iron export ABC transporter permease subunit FetB [Hyphomicrobiaceae bacterium]